MSRLLANSTPAERARGLIFSETFESSQKVAENGGTIASTPIIRFGMTTDGNADVVTYPEVRQVKSISFRVNLATTTEDILQLSSSLSIEAVSGTLTATGVSSPTFYVNGVATDVIGTSMSQVVITTETAFDADSLKVGQDDAFGQFEIKDLKLFTSVLTAQEVQDISDNTTYNYRNRAILDLPMGAENHDPTNNRTLDVSKSGAHATLGAGDGGVTTPTKLVKHGYDLDGGDYLTGTATGVFNSAQISIVVEFWPDFGTDENASRFLFDSSEGSRYLVGKGLPAGGSLLFVWLGDNVIENIVESVYSPFWRVGGKNILIIIGDSDNNITNMWLNEGQILTNNTAPWSLADPSEFFIGSGKATNDNFSGKITGFQIYPFLLSKTQMADILANSNKTVNRV